MYIRRGIILLGLFLAGCVGTFNVSSEFTYVPVRAGAYQIATWQKITNTDPVAPIYVFIEGDGHAFRTNGRPSSDPTPRGTFVRKLAMHANVDNVVYMARPCQFIMSSACTRHDWTDGRFSPAVVDGMADAISQVTTTHPIVLVGYSGGAMVSGLIIERHPEINAVRWITIAGVLNHAAWTAHFGDSPLRQSLDMATLPDIAQTHYVAEQDTVVPPELTRQIAKSSDIIVVPNARHDDFGNFSFDALTK